MYKCTYFRNQHQRLSRMLKWFASHSSNPKMANLSITTFARLEMKWLQSRSWWTMWENIFWARVWHFESWINAVKPTSIISNTPLLFIYLLYHLKFHMISYRHLFKCWHLCWIWHMSKNHRCLRREVSLQKLGRILVLNFEKNEEIRF